MKTGIENASFQIRSPGGLSSAEASLCYGEAGEKEKESVRGTMGRGKREERLSPFSSSHRPPGAFYFFDYCYFDGDTQRQPLRRRELRGPFLESPGNFSGPK